MDVQKVFHMTGGIGSTSYAKNSSLQKKGSDRVKHIIIETVEELYLASTPKSLGIADLGCSSGPNTLSIIRDIFESIQKISQKIHQPASELRVYLNDLPTNDFNSIFRALPDFLMSLWPETEPGSSPSIFMGAYPGSFYGRLFPNSSLHFVHSSYSLHWLSRVPPELYDEEGKSINKGCIYICGSSPEEVARAYYKQFREDFWKFLRARSAEVVAGGRMVLIFLGRRGPEHVDRGDSFLWEILARSFAILVSKGEVEEEKVDSYEVPFYAASREEIEEGVRREGSFEVERLVVSASESGDRAETEGGISYGKRVAMAVRAIQESIMTNHFGDSVPLESLFDTYASLLDQQFAIHHHHHIQPLTFVLVLRKL
ncbi:jasmonate O-methyltransferase-like [Neltuma alba]|uniref:jasmonate O-methyltransferase-like n=1 Tax=Neltuma alba TaxID=207710 RepID=UPI0010A4864D|nr:jasmonate O-methyltransferase-like [Prosopis alba]XP_028794415.1 jasmonate O-methyltransferase-like [Prosopis alba]